jgi:hypothetical protein
MCGVMGVAMGRDIPGLKQLAQLFAVAGVIARSVIKRTRVKTNR